MSKKLGTFIMDMDVPLMQDWVFRLGLELIFEQKLLPIDPWPQNTTTSVMLENSKTF